MRSSNTWQIHSSYLLMTTGLLSLDNLGARAFQVVAILTIPALQRAVIPWRANAEDCPPSVLPHWFRIWDNSFTNSVPCCSGLKICIYCHSFTFCFTIVTSYARNWTETVIIYYTQCIRFSLHEIIFLCLEKLIEPTNNSVHDLWKVTATFCYWICTIIHTDMCHHILLLHRYHTTARIT